MSFTKQSVQISQKNSQPTKNKLNTAFDNRLYSKWKGLRRLEWWHCVCHKDLMIKPLKLTIIRLFLFFDDYFEILNPFIARK